MRETEKIGKITLDYQYYAGEDLYCDGEIEDEILEIVKNHSADEFPQIIEEKKSWPILYHLSPLRENIVDWMPIGKSSKVLEVGSGCGAITGALARKAKEVTCVDLSKKRSLINAYRHKECDNITIHIGNFKDIEPSLEKDYDYICLIGVFEYGQGYMGCNNPYEKFIEILKSHLKTDGRLIIAIENKYGLKYFAGCKEDHLGTYFSGIENYNEDKGVKTFSRRGLENIFKACQVEHYTFYYPYPDYKFMNIIYSDDYMPRKRELCNNLRNFDRDRMRLFDETSAYNGIVEDGLYSVFANSYCVVIGPDFKEKYVKYSNDRSPEYQIKTEIIREDDKKLYVKKYPLSKKANGHIRKMSWAHDILTEKYFGGNLMINQCQLEENGEETCISFEYVDGTPLSALMDGCLEKNDIDGFYVLFKKYLEYVNYNNEYPIADFDMIFSNIIVKGEQWTLIDYEWTFEKAIEGKETAYRAIYCYLLEDPKREKINVDLILKELGLTNEEAETYIEREIKFQKFVTGHHLSLAQIRDLIGYKVLCPTKWLTSKRNVEDAEKVQIYKDCGEGYSEETSYFLKEAYRGDGFIECNIRFNNEVQALRIDPAMDSCVVKIHEVVLNGRNVLMQNKKNFLVNGRIAQKEIFSSNEFSIIFPTKDPNIHILLKKNELQEENDLYVKMEIVFLPINIAKDLANAAKKKI